MTGLIILIVATAGVVAIGLFIRGLVRGLRAFRAANPGKASSRNGRRSEDPLAPIPSLQSPPSLELPGGLICGKCQGAGRARCPRCHGSGYFTTFISQSVTKTRTVHQPARQVFTGGRTQFIPQPPKTEMYQVWEQAAVQQGLWLSERVG